jgi:hypothetical protein
MLLEDLGRRRRRRRFLAALDAGTLRPSAGGRRRRATTGRRRSRPPMAAPAEAPRPNRPGTTRSPSSPRRSPWSARDEVLRRAGTPLELVVNAAPQALGLRPAKESFQ